MQDKVLNEVKNLIRGKLNEKPNMILDSNTVLSELDINSITFVEIVVALEASFDFEFDDEKLHFSAFPTILSMAEYIESKIQY
jgi:acyl carrier protein